MIISNLKIKNLFSVGKIKLSKKELNAILMPIFLAFSFVAQLFLPPPTDHRLMQQSPYMSHLSNLDQYSVKGTTNV